MTIDKMKAVFLAALDKTAGAERTAFLDEACAEDAALRRSVDALLQAHGQTDRLLDGPAADFLTGPTGEGAGPDDSLGFLNPPSQADSLGRIGHYEALEVLGRGGFGIVLRAFDDSLQRVVALKVLAPQLAVGSPARKRFVREARASAKVRHENVVQVYAVEEQPLPYLVMEFIPGETLQQRLDRIGPLETAEVARIGRQIAEGLAAAHAQGLIHRDVKPGNILIEASANLCVKITDFGLARAADDASLTQSGFLAGTPMYMAPEQAHGDALDHRADLFSLGSVLYTMCSGRPPFRANNTLAVLKRVAEDTPRPIPEIIPEVPLWLCDIITRLHAKKPQDRISTAKEVADLLARGPETVQRTEILPPAPVVAWSEDHATTGGSAADKSVCPTPAIRPRFRSRRWAAAAAVLLLLLGFGFTEATGVTHFSGTVVRLFSPEGTLVVEVDDPGVSVKIDGSDIVITGAGAKEIRLKPGSYTVEASKDGKVVSRELVAVTKNGRQVVRVSQEAPPVVAGSPDRATTKTAKNTGNAAAWERSVAAMPAAEQVKAVIARLKELNPGFDGTPEYKIEGDVVTELTLTGPVADLSPVRALVGLKVLACTNGPLSDLSPLKNLKLTALDLSDCTQLSDLTPLQGMPLTSVTLKSTQVQDLQPLRGMPLTNLSLWNCHQVQDLAPLKGMPLTGLNLYACQVHDLTPLNGMSLTHLYLAFCTQVRDLTPLTGMPLTELNLDKTQVTDLNPLKGMQITRLSLWECEVSDLKPLEGMPLTSLSISDCPQVRDLEPLKGMPLTEFIVTPKNITQGLDVLRDMKNLKTISINPSEPWPAAEFWARYDKGQFK
jgi:eukaryotic-like serine/threonine-protein kinase